MAIEVGQIINGKISGLAKFGAFVDLPGGQTGLVHISEVSDKYIDNINDELSEGEEIAVKVLAVSDDGKISLSIRKVDSKSPSTEQKPSPSRQRNSKPMQRKQQHQDFDMMMSSFLKDSEDKLSSLKHQADQRRNGRHH